MKARNEKIALEESVSKHISQIDNLTNLIDQLEACITPTLSDAQVDAVLCVKVELMQRRSDLIDDGDAYMLKCERVMCGYHRSTYAHQNASDLFDKLREMKKNGEAKWI